MSRYQQEFDDMLLNIAGTPANTRWDFGAVLADIRAADADEAARKLGIAEVCERVRELLEACDGDSCIVLQEALEALERDRVIIEGVMG